MVLSVGNVLRGFWLALATVAGILINPIQSKAQGFLTTTDFTPLGTDKNTGEKPQSKVWKYADKWWSVFPASAPTDTYIWRLDGTTWVPALLISNASTVKADCKVVGDVCHILLWRDEATPGFQLISVQYVVVNGSYALWSSRPATTLISPNVGTETATIDIDGNNRMWLATDGTTDITVRWSDSPYSVWSAPLTLATGVFTDDISAVINMPVQGKVGVFWSDQTTDRFGFKTHINGDDPSIWSADEVPASQSALNIGNGMGDDHMSLAMASDGTLFCAVKTSYDTDTYPKISLLKRQPNGAWDNLYPVTITNGAVPSGTRPNVKLNEAIGKLKVFYTSLENSGDIVYRESDMSTISFSSEITLISGAYNNVTGPKDNYTEDIVILASTPASTNIQVVGVLAIDCIPPTTSLTVSTDATTVCSGSGTNVKVLLSQNGYSYQLRNNSGNSLIGSAVAGNGATISLPTGNLSDKFQVGYSYDFATTTDLKRVNSGSHELMLNYRFSLSKQSRRVHPQYF